VSQPRQTPRSFIQLPPFSLTFPQQPESSDVWSQLLIPRSHRLGLLDLLRPACVAEREMGELGVDGILGCVVFAGSCEEGGVTWQACNYSSVKQEEEDDDLGGRRPNRRTSSRRDDSRGYNLRPPRRLLTIPPLERSVLVRMEGKLLEPRSCLVLVLASFRFVLFLVRLSWFRLYPIPGRRFLLILLS